MEAAVSFLPSGFEIPVLLESPACRFRPLTIHDVVKDYDAVMSSRVELRNQFGTAWGGWPSDDLTLEQDLIDLGWHQKEFQRRSSFAYTVTSPDESRVLGCIYIFPSHKAGDDAAVYWWTRSDAPGREVAPPIERSLRAWIADAWPFERVAYPGVDIAWEEWMALPRTNVS